MDHHVENFGPPDLRLERLRVWIHGRQFPEASDFWDGNWLRVTVHYGACGANVWVSGPIIHLSEIAGWLEGCEAMAHTLRGESRLDCMEPELSVVLRMSDSLGHAHMRVEITPDHPSQEHVFESEIDVSYLADFVRTCKKVLAEFPIRGRP